MTESSFQEAKPQRRILVPGKLNVVGESHNESDLVRDEEKRFCFKNTQSTNYWTEAEFLDLQVKVGIRKDRGGQQPGDPAADLMEFRAAHSAAFLIAKFEKLANDAATVAATTPESAVLTAVHSFVDVKFRDFITLRDRLARSWRPTTSNAVNSAADAAFTNVENARKTYFTAIRNATPGQQLAATRALVDNRDALRALVPPLEKAVGQPYSPDRNAATLAHNMRVQRSSFMGLAAVVSEQIGVWKVGDLHIADLMDGTVKVDTSRMNLVTKEDFTLEFEAWKAK